MQRAGGSNLQFNVFLSYNGIDRDATEKIAGALERKGITVFFDRWYLTPGQPWQDLLQQHLDECRSVAVLLGPHGLGSWQQREQSLALDRQAHETEFPVIPVLLPGTKDPALGFLGLNTWIDLRRDLTDTTQIDILVNAISGKPPGRRRAGLFNPVDEICPYRGLDPFREEDAKFFFGRDAFVQQLTEKVKTQPFIAVVGASGSGKSSVVRAGLVPELRSQAQSNSRTWDPIVIRPGHDPLLPLILRFSPPNPDESAIKQEKSIKEDREALLAGEVSLADLVRRDLRKQEGTDRLLLIVDQWEELYTQLGHGAQTDEEKKRAEALQQFFIDQLIEASGTAPLTVVLTLRGDFYGWATQYRPLSDRLQDAVVNIGPMDRDELRQTIQQPAKAVGLTFERGLVNDILDDVGNEPGNLPLLEFLLKELWRKRDRGRLTREAYDAIGRVKGAVAKRAEDEFERLDGEEQQALRRFLPQLVVPGEGREDTRAKAELPTDDDLTKRVVRKLADERLLTTRSEGAAVSGGGREIVEMAHEALLRNWDRYRKWIDEDREELRIYRRVQAQQEIWEQEGKKRDRLLSKGRPLEEALQLLQSSRLRLTEATKEFIARSRRRANLANNILLGLGAFLVLLTFVAGLALWVAAVQLEASLKANQRAFERESLRLARLAREEFDKGHVLTATYLALQGTPNPDGQTKLIISVTYLPRFIEDQLADLYSRYRLQPHPETVGLLIRAHNKRQFVKFLLGHEDSVISAAFSPDGTRILTASWDDTARLWDAGTGAAVATLKGHEDSVTSAAFSPDGTRILTASADSTARLWDATTGEPIGKPLSGHEKAVLSAAFSPDGTRIVTASSDETARLWDSKTGALIATIEGHEGSVTSAAFSPDGTRILTASADSTARLWDAGTGAATATLKGHEHSVTSAVFNPDGTRILTASRDDTARLWDAGTGAATATLKGHEGSVTSAAFSPDGTRILTASWDNTARLWDAGTGAAVATLKGHEDSVTSAAFSPDGTRIVTISMDRTARLWDAGTGAAIATLKGHEGSVTSAAFSPDGTRIVTTSMDRTARLWWVYSSVEELTRMAVRETLWIPRENARRRFFLEDPDPSVATYLIHKEILKRQQGEAQ